MKSPTPDAVSKVCGSVSYNNDAPPSTELNATSTRAFVLVLRMTFHSERQVHAPTMWLAMTAFLTRVNAGTTCSLMKQPVSVCLPTKWNVISSTSQQNPQEHLAMVRETLDWWRVGTAVKNTFCATLTKFGILCDAQRVKFSMKWDKCVGVKVREDLNVGCKWRGWRK